jgi:hypothetical protein
LRNGPKESVSSLVGRNFGGIETLRFREIASSQHPQTFGGQEESANHFAIKGARTNRVLVVSCHVPSQRDLSDQNHHDSRGQMKRVPALLAILASGAFDARFTYDSNSAAGS